jgi:choline dehydrogenase-like flavoprotein
MSQFDAIVIGSGMSGGMAAKELCERGLKVLVIERGKKIEHGTDYKDQLQPWELPNNNMIAEEELEKHYPVQRKVYALNEATKQFWVKDDENPYTTPEDKPFTWIRGNHLGGRSIMWGRQSYRLAPMDFEANAKDGHGADWPIRYDDLAPWYSHVEKFIGVAGTTEGLEQLPDGEFIPGWEMNDMEKIFKSKVESTFSTRKVIIGRNANLSVAQPHHQELGRGDCQNRSICERGCTYGASYSSLSGALPAAEKTGNLTIVTDAIVHSLVYDAKTNRVTGVKVVDANTKEGKTYEAKIFFSCASTFGTAQILLNSKSETFKNGLANSSDMVGRNIMDHLYALSTVGIFPEGPNTTYDGRRPTGIYIPRFRNFNEESEGYVRGYGYQGGAMRPGWKQAALGEPGLGEDLKNRTRKVGPWMVFISGFGEVLPNPDNRMTLTDKLDSHGLPIMHIDAAQGGNEAAMSKQILADGKAMIEAAGGMVVSQAEGPGPLGLGIHEMGTACMGKDPKNSVLNKYNQTHDVPNLFITDGAAMASSGCVNPSLTYMALSARAADNAVKMLKEGVL